MARPGLHGALHDAAVMGAIDLGLLHHGTGPAFRIDGQGVAETVFEDFGDMAFRDGLAVAIDDGDAVGNRPGHAGRAVIEDEDSVGIFGGLGDPGAGGVQHRPDQIPGAGTVRREPDFRPGPGRGFHPPALCDKIEGEPGQDFTDQAGFYGQAGSGLLDGHDTVLEFEISPPQRTVHGSALPDSSGPHPRHESNTCNSRGITLGAEIA